MSDVGRPTTDSILLVSHEERQSAATNTDSETDNSSNIVLNCFHISGSIGVILLIILPPISLSMIKTVLNGSSSTAFNELACWSDILLIISYVVSLIGLCSMIRYDKNKNTPETTQTQKKYSSISIAFLFILGCGDSLFNLTRTVDQFLLISKADPNCLAYIWVSMVENLLKSFYQLCLLIFIINQIIENVKPSSRLCKSFILGLSCSILCQWLLLLFQEIDQDERHNDTCISNGSSSLYAFETIEPFLYPLGLEFRVSIFIHLLILSHVNFFQKFWNFLKKLYSLVKAKCKCRGIIDCPTIKVKCDTCCENCRAKFFKFFLIIMVPAFGMLIVSASMVFIFFQESNISGDEHGVTLMNDITNEKITLYSEMGEVALVSIILILSLCSIFIFIYYCCAKRDEHKKEIEYEFWIDFLFLFIAFVFLFVYCVYTCDGAVNTLDTSDTIVMSTKQLTITASLLSIFQAILQVIVIFYFGITGKCLPDTTNKLWITFNFALWLFDTFSAKEYITNKMQIDYHIKEHWEELNAILVPMTIFFRFHSCVMFTNIKDNIYFMH